MDAARYAFRLEFFDELSSVIASYQLLYYVRRDGKDEIEIMDSRHKRKFLSRVHYPALKLDDIVIGGKITM